VREAHAFAADELKGSHENGSRAGLASAKIDRPDGRARMMPGGSNPQPDAGNPGLQRNLARVCPDVQPSLRAVTCNCLRGEIGIGDLIRPSFLFAGPVEIEAG
jgi:hypothetical protein